MGKPLIPGYALEQGLVNSCLTRNADYEVYTGAMTTDENVDPGKYVLSMVGSSTIQDLQGDIMAISALEDMTKIPDGLTIFLNHSYNLPDDVMGGLYKRPWISSERDGIADYHLSVDVEATNPKAMQTYGMVQRKRRLGCSVGCQVLDYDYDIETGIITIKHVYVVEFSVVGIPAVQRAWVEVAAKSLFERALSEGRGDDALKLAPAIKGMYSRAYENLVKHIESPGLKRDLESVIPRGTSPHRIMYAFNDGNIDFILSDSKGRATPIARNEIPHILEKHMQRKAAAHSPVSPDVVDTTKDVDPCEKKDDAATIITASAEEILDSDSGAPLDRQDLEEEEKKVEAPPFLPEADVKIRTDDEDETPEHTHDGDHKDNAEKAVPKPDGTGVEVTTGALSASEIVIDSLDTTETIVGSLQIPQLDEQKLALLTIYNSFGAQLGFAPRAFGEQAQKSMMPLDDTCTPQDIITALSAADSQIDYLMRAFGVPDIDAGPDDNDDDDAPEYHDYPARYGAEASLVKSALALLVKEGRELSEKNKAIINAMHDHAKSVHDMCAAMHPEACKCASMQSETVDAATDEARTQGEGQPIQQYPSMAASIEVIGALAKSLAQINIKDVAHNAVNDALVEAHKSLDLLQREQRIMLENMRRLKEMPLGRPTTFAGRTTTVAEETTSYEDLLLAGVTRVPPPQTLEEVLAQTSVVETTNLKYREWSDGIGGTVGEGLRPRLTDIQKTFMSPLDIVRYNEGKSARVPVIGDLATV